MPGWLSKQISASFIGSLCYLEMVEGSEKCDKMFNEVDDGKWDISDDNEDGVKSNSEKEYDKVKANIKEIKLFSTFIILLIFDPPVVQQFFTQWLLEMVCTPLSIWNTVCSEIPFSKPLYHIETSQLICKANLYDSRFYWKMFLNRL